MADGSAPATLLDIGEIAAALRVTKRSAERRAQREHWPYTERTGKGGTARLYALADLPAGVQASVNKHLAIRAASQASASPDYQAGRKIGRELAISERMETTLQHRQQEAGAAAAAGLTGAARERMQARLDVLSRLSAFAARRNMGNQQTLEEFSAAYAAGEIEVNANTRAVLGDSVSPISLWRWRKTVKTQGPAALAGSYGNRAGTGKIESAAAVREFVIGLMADKPHITAAVLYQVLLANFHGQALPSARSVERFMVRWKTDNAAAFQRLTNPDAWKSQRMVAFGNLDDGIVRTNQLWMLDSTPSDIHLLDGRYTIVGAIDVATRMAAMHLSKTSSAEAVCQLLRRQILDWGVPEALKMDNGRDYTSERVAHALVGLGIEPKFSAPFSPWEKGNVERLFRSFSHGLLELLPGYLGHNVAEAQEIRARQAFSERLFKKNAVIEVKLTAADFQHFLNRWCTEYYAHRPHKGLDGATPFQRRAALNSTIRQIADPRALDLLLAEGGQRVVGKKGIRIDGLTYISADLATLVKEPVRVLKDDNDLGRIVVYHNDAFVCVAECPEVAGVSRQEIAIEAKARQSKAAQAAQRELKAQARKIDTRQLVQDVLDRKAADAAALVAFPAPNVVHITPALDAASTAADALDGVTINPSPVTTLADVAVQSKVLRMEQMADDGADARFREALSVLITPEAERNDIQRVRLRRALESNEFQARWMCFTDFGPASFQLPDDYLVLMPDGALYHRFKEAQLLFAGD